MLHLDTPLIVGIFIKPLRAKYGKSRQKRFVDFHFAATQIVIEYFDLVHISQHNGNYKMIPF